MRCTPARPSARATASAPRFLDTIGGCKALEMVLRVAELLRDHRQSPKRVAHLQLIAHAHAAMQLDSLLAHVTACLVDPEFCSGYDALPRRGVACIVDAGASEAGHRFGLFRADDHVDHPVLQRLKRAD